MTTGSRSLVRQAAEAAGAGVRRLRGVLWPIAQTAVAAGLAWWLARDVLGHQQPFFAPIAAAVCLSASNVLRGQRAVQMIIGVALGIGLGIGAKAWLGTGPAAIGVAVFICLCVAVLISHGFIGQGLMFYNQTAASAILVLAFGRSTLGFERLFDALIGGGIAIAFSVLLFPANPLKVLRSAFAGVLGTLRDVLAEVSRVAGQPDPPAPDWSLSAADRVNQQLANLAQARGTAREIVRAAPGRWPARPAVRVADQRATQLTLLAGSVLYLADTVTTARAAGFRLPGSLHEAIRELAAAGEVLAGQPPDGPAARAAAAPYVASARQHSPALHRADPDVMTQAVAVIVNDCATYLQQLIGAGRDAAGTPETAA